MLVVQQVKGEYEMNGENMTKYPIVVRALITEFPSWSINKIPRAENVEADKLSKFTSITIPKLEPKDREKKVLVEYLLKPSTQKKEEVLEGHIG